MRFSSVFRRLLKGKLLAIALVSIAAIGGTAAMAASTPGGQDLVHALVGLTSATSTPAKPSPTRGTGREATATPGANGHAANCPGLPEAQNLAASFSLSTDTTSDAVQAMCSLHQGTFKGTTPGGAAISSSRVFGYGEIQDVLTYAHYLATHDATNPGGTLTNSNARSYLAEALQRCGTSPLETCLATNIPGFHPGKSGSSGQPTSTPTPPAGGKPTSTPTPPGGGKPTSTPTPPAH
jgi:hypothetical protein